MSVTAEQVRQLSKDKGISLYMAKKRLEKQQLLHRINGAETLEDLRALVYKLAEKTL